IFRRDDPVAAPRSEQVVERRNRKAALDRARRRVALAYQSRAVLIAILERAEPEYLIFYNRPANAKSHLLSVEGRIRIAAIKRRGQPLQIAVAGEERS